MGGEDSIADGDALAVVDHPVDFDRRKSGGGIVGVAAGHATLQRRGVTGARIELGAGVPLDLGDRADMIVMGVVADDRLHPRQRRTDRLDVSFNQRRIFLDGPIQQDRPLP